MYKEIMIGMILIGRIKILKTELEIDKIKPSQRRRIRREKYLQKNCQSKEGIEFREKLVRCDLTKKISSLQERQAEDNSWRNSSRGP